MLFGVYAGKILIYIVESNNKSKINFRDSLLFYNSMGWISLRSRKALRCLGFQAG